MMFFKPKTHPEALGVMEACSTLFDGQEYEAQNCSLGIPVYTRKKELLDQNGKPYSVDEQAIKRLFFKPNYLPIRIDLHDNSEDTPILYSYDFRTDHLAITDPDNLNQNGFLGAYAIRKTNEKYSEFKQLIQNLADTAISVELS